MWLSPNPFNAWGLTQTGSSRGRLLQQAADANSSWKAHAGSILIADDATASPGAQQQQQQGWQSSRSAAFAAARMQQQQQQQKAGSVDQPLVGHRLLSAGGTTSGTKPTTGATPIAGAGVPTSDSTGKDNQQCQIPAESQGGSPGGERQCSESEPSGSKALTSTTVSSRRRLLSDSINGSLGVVEEGTTYPSRSQDATKADGSAWLDDQGEIRVLGTYPSDKLPLWKTAGDQGEIPKRIPTWLIVLLALGGAALLLVLLLCCWFLVAAWRKKNKRKEEEEQRKRKAQEKAAAGGGADGLGAPGASAAALDAPGSNPWATPPGSRRGTGAVSGRWTVDLNDPSAPGPSAPSASNSSHRNTRTSQDSIGSSRQYRRTATANASAAAAAAGAPDASLAAVAPAVPLGLAGLGPKASAAPHRLPPLLQVSHDGTPAASGAAGQQQQQAGWYAGGLSPARLPGARLSDSGGHKGASGVNRGKAQAGRP
jgi:hypothetical protein